MLKKEVQRWFFVLLISLLSHIFIWLSFGNIYSAATFNFAHFEKQYHSGVYQYRVLSVWLVENLYPILKRFHITVPLIGGFPKDFDSYLFTSIFFSNLIFCTLMMCMILLLTSKKYIDLDEKTRTLLPLLGALICAISQFVVLPYDYSAWFFLLLGLWLTLQAEKTRATPYYILLGLCLFISTLNRETSALTLALWAAFVFNKEGFSRRFFVGSFLGAVIFLSAYLGIRWYFGVHISNDGSMLMENLSKPQNVIGGLFMVLLYGLSLFISLPGNRKLIHLFHLFSIFYLITCVYTGILYEIRLYVPMFISSILLGNLSFKQPYTLSPEIKHNERSALDGSH